MIVSLLTDKPPEQVAKMISRAINLPVTQTERKGAHLIVTIPGATPAHAEELAGEDLGPCVVLDEQQPTQPVAGC